MLKAFGTPLRAVKPREVAADREAREGLQIADKTVCGLGVPFTTLAARGISRVIKSTTLKLIFNVTDSTHSIHSMFLF